MSFRHLLVSSCSPPSRRISGDGTDVPFEANAGDTSSRLAKVSAKIDSKASAITPVRKKNANFPFDPGPQAARRHRVFQRIRSKPAVNAPPHPANCGHRAYWIVSQEADASAF